MFWLCEWIDATSDFNFRSPFTPEFFEGSDLWIVYAWWSPPSPPQKLLSNVPIHHPTYLILGGLDSGEDLQINTIETWLSTSLVT